MSRPPVLSSAWVLLLGMGLGSCSCRVEPGPGGAPEDTAGPELTEDLGPVAVGGTLVRVLPLQDEARTAAAPSVLSGPFEVSLDASGAALRVEWRPTAEGPAVGTLRLADGSTLGLTAEGVAAPGVWPAPVAALIGHEAFKQVPATGLGEASLAGTGPVAVAEDPVSGNVYVGDPDLGRAWRLDPFYRHPNMGLWVSPSREDRARWTTPPDCFEDINGLNQTGTCTGEERDADGTIPSGWRFYHGGFAGDEGALSDLVSLVADEARGRLWVTLPGGVEALDMGMDLVPSEGGDVYLYTQHLPLGGVPLGDDWTRPWATLDSRALVLLDLDDGQLARLDPDSGALTALTTLDTAVEAVSSDDRELLVRTGDTVRRLDRVSGEVQGSWEFPAGLLEGLDRGTGRGEQAWLVGGGLLLSSRRGSPEAPRLLAAPDGGVVIDAVMDTVSGGTAETLSLLYVVGQTDGEGWLRAATPDGAWLGEAVALPAVPRALGQGAAAHDLHVIFEAGDDGCDGDFAPICDAKGHAAVISSYYNPYGLVPPTSGGHPLNLFLHPIIETPKDADVNSDFTAGAVCAGEADPVARGCCSLGWTLDERLGPNVDYLREALGTLGAGTSASLDDDPTFAWGLNNSVVRQAILCLDSEEPEHQEIGREAILFLGELSGEREQLTHWTHTAIALGLPESENHRFYLDLLYTEGVDYTLPLEDQAGYALLHDGIAAAYTPSVWTEDPELLAVDLGSTITSGNALDTPDLVDPVLGWPEEASWLVPVRDGPLAVGEPARSTYTFLSLGADPSVGDENSRKKELWPTDIRQRTALTWLAEDALDFGISEAGSGVVNLPGMSWELGTLRDIPRAGAYRETLKYGQIITDENWVNVRRMLRRLIASSQAEDVKSWYQHIFDLTNPGGLMAVNSGVTEVADRNREALQAIEAELIEPGYARWATPAEIEAEWLAAQGED